MEATLEPPTLKIEKRLLARAQPKGGFTFTEPIADQPEARPDATAWAALALTPGGAHGEVVASGLDWLGNRQREAGQVVYEGDDRLVYLTSLACLAFQTSPAHTRRYDRALAWLLDQRGLPGSEGAKEVNGHDTSLRGWSFITRTHSWIEPTAMVLTILAVAAKDAGKAEQEAITLVLDRQLPAGGWNYGNTRVFDNILRPLVHTTGVALSGLAGRVSAEKVERSLTYLEGVLPTIRTPLSLAWGLLGLAAWGRRPEAADQWLGACAGHQDRVGPYNTELLAILLLAAQARSGLPAALRKAAGEVAP